MANVELEGALIKHNCDKPKRLKQMSSKCRREAILRSNECYVLGEIVKKSSSKVIQEISETAPS